ncbi:MAG: PKD domain-containing protein, partial [Flavobacteriales bacterium]
GGGSFSEVFAFGTDPANELYWMEQSYADHDVMYVQQAMGGSSSKMWRTLDHGLTWNQIPLPSTLRYLCFTTSATNANELWVGYYDGSNGNKVYHTVDAGQNWENLTTSTLNGQSVWGIAHQFGTDGGVYLAMLHGVVYYRNNAMSDWVSYSTGLPVSTEPLRIVPFIRDQVVRLATWNLGVWEAPCYEPSSLIADFSAAYQTFFCPGDEVHFVNHSVCSANATFSWSFPGGTPSVSTEPYPNVVYASPGTYDVTLTVTDGGQSQTVTHTNYISNEEPVGFDVSEDFESGAIPSEWRGDGSGAWSISQDASAYGLGTYSMRFDNYYYDAQGARDRIWLGKRAPADEVGLSFDVAYAQYSDGYSDTLAVVYSTDCGATWTSAWVVGGDELSNAPDNTGYYIPGATEWTNYALVVQGLTLNQEYILAFENRGHYGNVIYVDNVNIYTLLDVKDVAHDSDRMLIYPNPVSDHVQISARGVTPGAVSIDFFDAQGKLVYHSSVLAAGERLERNLVLPEWP